MAPDLFGQLLFFLLQFSRDAVSFSERGSNPLAWVPMSCIILCVCPLLSSSDSLLACPWGFSRWLWGGLPFSSPRGSSQTPCLNPGLLVCCTARGFYLLGHWGSPMWYQLKLPFQPQFCNSLFSSTDLPLRADLINILLACSDVKI